jgi:hypothetical protein
MGRLADVLPRAQDAVSLSGTAADDLAALSFPLA